MCFCLNDQQLGNRVCKAVFIRMCSRNTALKAPPEPKKKKKKKGLRETVHNQTSLEKTVCYSWRFPVHTALLRAWVNRYSMEARVQTLDPKGLDFILAFPRTIFVTWGVLLTSPGLSIFICKAGIKVTVRFS